MINYSGAKLFVAQNRLGSLIINEVQTRYFIILNYWQNDLTRTPRKNVVSSIEISLQSLNRLIGIVEW